METPPNAEDLAGPSPRSLDEKVVLEHFLGKSREEIRTLLPKSGHLQEDFMWMWPAGLRYYLPAVLDYLLSDESRSDWELSEGLLCSLSVQVRNQQQPKDVLALIETICNVVDQNRSKFLPEHTGPELERYIARIREATRSQ